MNTDNLDTLNDAQLSEVFAVEVAGWRKITFRRREIWDAHGIPYTHPTFATSADAVLPFLEKYEWGKFSFGPITIYGYEQRWSEEFGRNFRTQIVLGEGPKKATFARAACIALILAKRAEPLPGSQAG